MGFKLVRVDAAEPYKISLPLGSHFIGRGKFLDCNDNRVSRNHAELIVTSDSILLKSHHQNPCFVKKKTSSETLIFSQPESQVLGNGDQFGLIPENFWYEIIHTHEDSPTQNIDNQEVRNVIDEDRLSQDVVRNESDTQFYNHQAPDEVQNCSQSVLEEVFNAPFDLPEENQTSPTIQARNELNSQSNDLNNMDTIATEQEAESTDQSDKPINEPGEPNIHVAVPINQPASINQTESSPQSENPNKRLHSEDDSPSNVKKIKTEPMSPSNNLDKGNSFNDASSSDQGVKAEPASPNDAKPGPSSVQGPSNTGTNNLPPMPPSPTKPPNNLLRERCMYGANCYRRNPQHKAQFSHPTDADWGSGPQGVCPWGAACLRTDPRHWRDHQHPPGVQPPQHRPRGNRPGMQVFRRQGYNFYINANSVHFYDDHFEVEDSDGDSVDYDYEF